MTKYGFEYFTQRANVFNEMARPSPWPALGEAGSRLKQLFDFSSKVMAKGGSINIKGKEIEVPGFGGNRAAATNLLFTLYSLFNDNVSLEEELKQSEEELSKPKEEQSSVDLTWKCCDILDIPDLQYKQYELSDVDKLYRAAIKKLIETKPDYILSEEYKNKVTSPENILRFVALNRFRTATSRSIATKRTEEFGFNPETTNPEEIDRIQARTGIADIVAAIKKEQANRKRKFVRQQKKGVHSSDIAPQDSEETGDKYIDNVYMVLDALELLIERSNNIKKDINARFNSIPQDRYKSLSADNIQTILNAFLEELGGKYHNFPIKFLKSFYVRPTSFYEELTKTFQELLDTGISMSDFYDMMNSLRQKHASIPGINTLIDALVFEVEELIKLTGDLSRIETDNYDPYKNIDNDILKKYIPNPEIGKKVKEYFDMEKKQHQITMNNIKRRLLSSEIKQASDAFLVQKEIEKLQNEISSANSSINKLSSESYIMNYMTEQVSKDRFKPKGEFKDRGFKKMNYLEWLEKNQ